MRSATPGPGSVDVRVGTDTAGQWQGAEVDVWHSSPEGLYENQDPAQAEMNLRGRFTRTPTGRFHFRSVKPAGYPIPIDGPVGELVNATGRHNYRPAHLHFMIYKPGFKTLISQIYSPDDEHLDSDVQFGVTRALIGDYVAAMSPSRAGFRGALVFARSALHAWQGVCPWTPGPFLNQEIHDHFISQSSLGLPSLLAVGRGEGAAGLCRSRRDDGTESPAEQPDHRIYRADGYCGGVGGRARFQKINGMRQQTPLRIVFEGSASGLHKGGNVNFDGVQIGTIKSLKLDNPRKVVALVMVDNSAPIRKDTAVGLEFQGLTGIAAISLTGGEAAAAAGAAG